MGYWGNSGEFEGSSGGKFERFVNGINSQIGVLFPLYGTKQTRGSNSFKSRLNYEEMAVMRKLRPSETWLKKGWEGNGL